MIQTNLINPSENLNIIHPDTALLSSFTHQENAFTIAELEGRNFFSKIASSVWREPNFIFTEHPMCGWDVEMNTGDNYHLICEIKKREKPISAYNDWAIEVGKYETLAQEIATRRIQYSNNKMFFVYVNFFSDGSFLIWYPEFLGELRYGRGQARYTTCGYGDYINKSFFYLPTSSAHISGAITSEGVKIYSRN